jgi:hypothetical protein
MRKLLILIVLLIVALLAMVQFGPSLLFGAESTPQDSRPAAGPRAGPPLATANSL